MKIIFEFLKPQRKLMFWVLILASFNQVFSMLDPLIGGKILNEYLSKTKNYTFGDYVSGMAVLLLLAVSVAMVSRIAKNFQDYFLNVAIQKSGTNLFLDGIKRTLDLPYELFEDKRSGDTLNILQKVRGDSERFIQLTVNLIFTSLVGVVFVMIIAFTVHWLIAPMFVFAMLVVGIISSVLSKKIKIIQKQIVGQTAALAGTTTESLRNIELVKSLGLMEQENQRIQRNSGAILDLELEKVKKIRTLNFLQGTTVNLMRNLLLLFLSILVFRGIINPGNYITFLFYSFFIFNPLQELGTFIQSWRETQISVQNYKDLMNSPSEPMPEKAIPMGQVESIEFKQVSFQHQSANRKALDNVSFKIKKGETIAFAGPSGSGKSTLVKLLIGLYEPKQGDLLYNNIPHSNVSKIEFRKQLGIVSQESQLFSGTIRDNLLFVLPTAKDQEMMEALDKAAAHSLMQRAEKGLDTQIGEGGIKVSGGEKQRISIARALLRNPNILIFDEATSALDSITEAQITETLHEVSKNSDRINVLIAHRLSTIAHADRIYVLEKGNIVEFGTHQELIAKQGLYSAMWRQQIAAG